MMWRVGVVFSVFLVSLCGLYLLGRWTLESEHALGFPSSLEELKITVRLLSGVSLHKVIPLFCSAYLFKQTFAIPGSIFLNIMAGAMFGLPAGFLLTCTLTAIGATLCYSLARFVGREFAEKYFPKAVSRFRQRLEASRHRLPFCLLSLRLFPCSPNWAVNMCSGVLGIRPVLFFATVFVGLMPYNFVCIQTGVILTTVESPSDLFTSWTILQLTGIALVALIPSLFVSNCAKDGSKVNAVHKL